jgi:hypothetical protein
MDQYINDRDLATYAQFIAAFRKSMVGISASGGEFVGVSSRARAAAEHPIMMGRSLTPDGYYMVLVFADPAAFIDNFGMKFNAEIEGNELFKVVMGTSEVEGVQVNSATSKVSVVISRHTISLVLGHDPIA